MDFLTYTNILLQTIGEVPLTSLEFNSAKGIHQFTKETVNRVYFDIIGDKQWTWMQDKDVVNPVGQLELTGERSLTPVGIWTTIPVTDPYKDAIDWSTIYFEDLEGNRKHLHVVSWEQFENGRDTFQDVEIPHYIIQSADGRSFGLHGMPMDNGIVQGKIYFRIWTRPLRFNTALEIIPMPDIHYQVLIDGAMSHLWARRDNMEQSQLSFARYQTGIDKMKRKYTSQVTRMRWV